jgi:hypothetical protein
VGTGHGRIEKGVETDMVRKSLTFHLTVAALAVSMPVLAAAEQSDQPPTPAVKANAGAVQSVRPPGKPVARRAGATQASPWTIKDALPDRSLALRPYEPPASPGLGRLPLKSGNGSFGFEMETRVKANETPDGHIIPGLAPNEHKTTQSFVGLSLSMPTSDNGPDAPAPRATPW